METVWLQRPGADTPWGFRLHGGRDYQTPLTVQKVTPGSIAATGLSQDDVIVRVGDTEMSSLTYTQAMDVIKNSGNLLQLSISKGGQGVYSPQVEASNMASDALHDLFHDMYRHSDGYSQEGAHSQSTAQPSYPYQPSYSTGPGAGSAPEPTARYDPYGGQQYGQPDSYCAGNIGAGASPAPPSQAPPSYREPQQPAAHPATRLEQQLSNMGLDDYGRPLNSFGYAAGSPQQSPGQPPSAPAPPGPYYGGAPKTPTSPPTPKQHAMPDAVLNMAARGEPDKKPFTYAPDMESIKEQRDKVRRRAPGGGMPRYQQMLNLPQFDDSPVHQVPQSPPTPSTPDYIPGPGEADVSHLQYNSPLHLYSENNVTEAFTGQTDGLVTGVGGLKKDGGKDITQSPVYRMIHGLDESKPKPRAVNAQPQHAPEATVSEVMAEQQAEREQADQQDNFDEDAYLAGRLNMMGGDAKPPPTRRVRKKPRAPWEKQEEEKPEPDFDEDAYLQGKLNIMGDDMGPPKTDVNRYLDKPKIDEEPEWAKKRRQELVGRKKRSAAEPVADGDVIVLTQVDDRPRESRKRAPWERVPEEVTPVADDVYFDEHSYLTGRDPYVRKSEEKEGDATPSDVSSHGQQPAPKKVHYLRRSESRELPPPSSYDRHNSYDEDEDPNKAFNEMVYVGKKIPSKIFARLQQSVEKKPRTIDPLDHLRERITDGLDVDAAMEQLAIDRHDPDEYLEQLKQTVEANNNIKIEAVPNEVTDF